MCNTHFQGVRFLFVSPHLTDFKTVIKVSVTCDLPISVSISVFIPLSNWQPVALPPEDEIFKQLFPRQIAACIQPRQLRLYH